MNREVNAFIRHHFRHFNAAALVDATDGYINHLAGGGKMLITLAGAMSTAELGLSLAEMIRQGKGTMPLVVPERILKKTSLILSLTDHYVRIPHYRDLTSVDEEALLGRHLNRVTDTCIPEEEAIRRLENAVLSAWTAADESGERYFPHEFLYEVLRSGALKQFYQIDPKDSWMMAAADKNLPMVVPGWEDSTLGNIYASHCIQGNIKKVHTVRSGIEYMIELADWYQSVSAAYSIGFFQIGGGIAGDFPICVVPMLEQDLEIHDIPRWGYFCQISDSTTSYGSYSGAVPNEKITWGKLSAETPKYIIESDATIVAPLIFAGVLASDLT